ncbi:hypothetical protein G6M89_17760 [Natronolimnobius sp. AArcel1]|uniref:HalOD1 output domain-containing protein n=1 Tax=Natronolimnobius sp. AArcel1 TaxID=1679093 RepID=UPI0013ED6AC1|nr:HalOD1 output domain-containing protein [Natronolimnobius sp. AArcel1]NGM70824.1 hypothetical protein [Natronolimnobius sp. AArcel1]
MSAPDEQSSVTNDVTPSRAIIDAVARAEGVGITEVEPPAYAPLYAAVNPESLDQLIASSSATNGVLRLVFEYEDYEVTVTGDGSVSLTPLERA